MEQEPFKLEHALATWRNELRAKGIAPEVIEELESHLVESAASLRTGGLNEAESFRLAIERLGDPADLAATPPASANDPIPAKPSGCKKPVGLALLLGGVLLMLAAVLGPVITYLAPKQYLAQSKIQVDRSPEISPPASFQSVAEVLESRETLDQVVAREGLAKLWLISDEEASAKLKGNLRVEAFSGTDVIEIGVYDPDPQLAAKLANTVVAVYLQGRPAAAPPNGSVPKITASVLELAEPPTSAAKPLTAMYLVLSFFCGAVGLLAIIIGVIVLVASRKRAT